MVDFDNDKARANLRKHGIAFAACEPVFNDPHALTADDGSDGEHRFNTIGMDAVGSIVVTWTDRNHDIRIISARKATASERKTYDRTRD